MQLTRIMEGVDFVAYKNYNLNIDLKDIVYDSRKAKPDTMFVCLNGSKVDGHKFAINAYNNGCTCFLAEHYLDLPAECIQLIVCDTRATLAVISANFFNHPSNEIKVIGITGTKGKTTTAHIVQALIEASGIKCGIVGTLGAAFGDFKINTVNTTPESYELQRIFRIMVDNGCKVCVIEVSSTGLKFHRTDCVNFEVGVFTNLSPDHIGANEHPTFEDYMYWKSVLFERCKKVVVNIDDPAYEFMLKNCKAPVITYGLSNADITAEKIRLIKKPKFLGIKLDCVDASGKFNVELPLPGMFNAHNALAAIGACRALGVNVENCLTCLKDLRINGRAECVYVSDDYDVIIDYAHNGISMKSMLDILKSYPHNKVYVLYGAVGGRAQIRRKELGLLTGKECDLSILTSDDPDYEDPMKIINEIGHYVEESGGKYVGIPDRGEAVEYALSLMKKGDILLLAGKGHEQYMKIKGERVPFSEKEHIEIFKRKRAKK